MMSEKLKILSEVNQKIHDFQNVMKVQLKYDDGKCSSFDLLKDSDAWVQDKEFGGNSRYKTLLQHNKSEDETVFTTLFEGKKGNVINTHNHREPHLFICLDGSIKATVDDNEYFLEKEKTLFVGSFQQHKFEFITDATLLILVLNI